MDTHKREPDHRYKEQEKYRDGVASMVKFLKGQIEELVWKRIKRSSHPSSGKSLLEHIADKELMECIEYTEQECGVNGDEKDAWKPKELFRRSTELKNLKQGDQTEEEYKREIKHGAKFFRGKGGTLFIGTLYLHCLLEEEG